VLFRKHSYIFIYFLNVLFLSICETSLIKEKKLCIFCNTGGFLFIFILYKAKKAAAALAPTPPPESNDDIESSSSSESSEDEEEVEEGGGDLKKDMARPTWATLVAGLEKNPARCVKVTEHLTLCFLLEVTTNPMLSA
jgi:hypothetical protein